MNKHPSFRSAAIWVVICQLTAGAWAASAPGQTDAQEAVWHSFKERFLRDDGRVVDDANGGVSHSEGQGYGLILAEANHDQESFDRIWKWTDAHLRRRSDRLFAWRWKPGFFGAQVDQNNATDGDLLIAWGLCRAASTWQNPAFRDASAEIASGIRQKLIRASKFGPVLLPGTEGFEKPEGLIVNLSYWVFPAFRALAKVDPAVEWPMLEQSGLKLIGVARFSPFDLPPDWLLIGKDSVDIADGFEPVYGYNATRIPLYLAWAGIEPARYYSAFRQIGRLAGNAQPPARVFLPAGNFGEEAALPGMRAIYELIEGPGDLHPAALHPPYRNPNATEPYFSVSLGLLANCAGEEAGAPRP
ncbi:MAG: endoglucanase [Verrucomicrobia bacterium]|nr:endoglucanase [Verrucomicrobiota bacterium]